MKPIHFPPYDAQTQKSDATTPNFEKSALSCVCVCAVASYVDICRWLGLKGKIHPTVFHELLPPPIAKKFYTNNSVSSLCGL
jgi:hypothetical protein